MEWSFFREGEVRAKRAFRPTGQPSAWSLMNADPLSSSSAGTHPVRNMSVWFTVRQNSPFSVGPRCARVSPAKNPGDTSTQ